MKDPNPDRDLLASALNITIPRWEKAKSVTSFLSQYPPDQTVLLALEEAIENCEVFKRVRGHSLFSGYAGFILTASSLAAPLLYRADRRDLGEEALADAAEWLIRVLETRHAVGKFIVAIWGLSVEQEVDLGGGLAIVPFDHLQDSTLKRRVTESSDQPWDGSVWMSPHYHSEPSAALVQNITKFPYIGSPAKGARMLAELEAKAKATLAFLQACVAGQPLVGGSWFEYEDHDLDINEYENYLIWLLPEVIPRVRSAVSVDVPTLRRYAAALRSIPSEWRNTLQRSMERFVLSQCRHQIVDKALDLALAFEIAVAGGKGDNAPPGWKVSVRSAQMIGGTLERRRQVRASVSALYRLRNTGAHGGSLNDAERQQQEDTIVVGVSVYCDLFASFLSSGRQPDWQTLELKPRTRE